MFYVEHWDGPDPYNSSFLAQRYGITEKQIDGYIKSQGYDNLDSRATGKEFLRLQEISGIDVRVLIAFAQIESGFGTKGVTKNYSGANIFGYGAFDNNPDLVNAWTNDRAVQNFRQTQIDGYGNNTLFICDSRALAFHSNSLEVGQAVYWTALDSGKDRAVIELEIDKYIDDNGGTPAPPGGYASSNKNINVLETLLGTIIPGTYGGITGQCYTVPAYYAHQINSNIVLNGGVAAADIWKDYNWNEWGWTIINNPQLSEIKSGDIITFNRHAEMGGWFSSSLYGHVGVVEKVSGNKITIYDQNPTPLKKWDFTYNSKSIGSVIRPPSN